MNILFLTTHVNTGGITSYILTLGSALVKSGHKVWVVSGGGDNAERMEALGMRHVKLNIKTKSEVHPKLVFSLPQVVQLIRQNNISVIHAQTRVTQVLGTWARRVTGVPLVTTCHGFFRPRWFRRTFPCWGNAVIAISKPVAEHLRRDFNIPQRQIRLIANGIDLNRFTMGQHQTGKTPLIGTIARLSDVKGLDYLIKAMPDVLKKTPSANLLIAGQGPEEVHLKKLTEDLSLNGHIQFSNATNQAEMLLKTFDVFVMPSLMEGLGLSVMEAQACGVPVVASRVGGLIDLIIDGKTGYLVESRDPSALAERIVKIIEDPDQAKVMAQAARLNIENNFSADLMCKKTLGVYEEHPRR